MKSVCILNMQKAGLNFEGEQTSVQAILISLALIYLTIPNLLFLWGWFEPWFAVVGTLIIVFSVCYAIGGAFPPRSCWPHVTLRSVLFMMSGCAVSIAVSSYFLIWPGLIGFLPSFYDLEVLRNAMFLNLRDAAWPLVLPCGKEMSYYLAGILPSALIARLLPEWGQWPVVVWTMLGMLLSLLLVSACIPNRRKTWGIRLMWITLMAGVLCVFCVTPEVRGVLNIICGKAGVPTLAYALPGRNALFGCGACYNSYPYALVATALILVCRREPLRNISVALALLVPLNPFAGIGLLPLYLVRISMEIRHFSANWPRLFVAAPLPLLMAFVCLLYFVRADGDSVFTLAGESWGWGRFSFSYVYALGGWLILLVPIWKYAKRDTFLYSFLLSCIFMPFLFIGTQRVPGEGGNNEFTLKVAPAYMLIVCCYWMVIWTRMRRWYRTLVISLCCLYGCYTCVLHLRPWGSNAYLEVNDRWNGHLNHPDSFLNQSIPPCREPFVSGVMLRQAGASEWYFPGSLLPNAPGCDYSRPACD